MPIPLASGLLTFLAPLGQNLIQNRMNKNMANYTYSKDLAMWEKQNEYNSPRNQMLRLKAAGLNPNLAYQQASTGNAVSMPKYTPPDRKVEIPNTIAILNQFQDFALKSKQLDLLGQNIDIAEKTYMNKDIQNALLNLELNMKDPLAFKKANESTWKLPGAKSLSEYTLDAARLKNQQTEQSIRNMLSAQGVTDQTYKWAKLRYETMLNSNVNIDKDQLFLRFLGDIFGEKVKGFKDLLKSTIR